MGVKSIPQKLCEWQSKGLRWTSRPSKSLIIIPQCTWWPKCVGKRNQEAYGFDHSHDKSTTPKKLWRWFKGHEKFYIQVKMLLEWTQKW